MSTLDLGQLITAAIVSLVSGGGLVALIRARTDQKKIQAEAHKYGADAAAALSDAAIGLVEPLRQEIDRLTKRVHELEGQIDNMSSRLERADVLLKQNGIKW